MTAAQLNFYGSWASILSLLISLISLVLIQTIRRRIITSRRRRRLQNLISETLEMIQRDQVSFALNRYKLTALEHNLPAYAWPPFTARHRALKELKTQLRTGDPLAIEEALHDWNCFSEDI
jgi:hypothetical protein